MMQEKARLRVTKDYDLFEMHEVNRDIQEDPVLLASMKEHGFMPSSPIHCASNGSGKLKIVRGHHRYHYARKLKLPIWYIVDNSNTDIYDLEATRHPSWVLRDFLRSYAKAGKAEYKRVLSFQEKHGLTQQVTISLLAGISAGSHRHATNQEQVKRGTFQVAQDLSHAMAVVNITDYFREKRIPFATRASFVKAVSMVVRVPEFEPNVLKHRLAQAPALMQERTNTEGYLDELEALYNYGAKGKRMALAYLAREVGRQRQATFGGKRPDLVAKEQRKGRAK